METLKKHRERIVSGTVSSLLILIGIVLSVLLAVYLKEPLYPDTSVKGMMIIFAAVGVAFPGLLGLLTTIYKSVSWVLNIHAPIEAMCIMAAFTSFIALKNGIISVNIPKCIDLTESRNSTTCICKNLATSITCDDLASQQTRSSAIFGVFVCALILLFVDIILSSRKLCCTDEIPEIPGIIEKDDSENKKKDDRWHVQKLDKRSRKHTPDNMNRSESRIKSRKDEIQRTRSNNESNA